VADQVNAGFSAQTVFQMVFRKHLCFVSIAYVKHVEFAWTIDVLGISRSFI